MTRINRLPPPPQTGYHPLVISAEQQKLLLSRRVDADRTDLFVNDPDRMIRTLGRLALRRGLLLTADYLALGDLCAQRSLYGTQLLILYVGKAIMAYRRAESVVGANSADHDVAQRAIATYVRWVIDIAEQLPIPHNIAVALWAVAEWQPTTASAPYQTALKAIIGQIAANSQLSENNIKNSPDIDRRVDLLSITSPTSDNRPLSLATSIDSLDESIGGNFADEQPTIAPSIPLDSVVYHTPLRNVDPGEYRRGDRIGPKSDPERYEIYKVWRGGMGIVYAAYDRAERYPVALKTIQTRLDRRAERDLYDRFVHEARTWIKLEKHPHVVQALILQTIADRPYLALEYVGGPEGLGSDLSLWIEHRRIDLAQALEIALHICHGMQHAVTRVPNLVHRDLKPANILVTTDGVAKVTDFGLAYAVQPLNLTSIAQTITHTTDPDRHLTHVGMVPGTPQYLSPEQCRAEPLDARSDIYALGIILFEMLTNRPLYSAHTPSEWLMAHQTDTPRFPEDLVSTQAIPLAVRDLVLRCLARNREDRPGTWDILATELARLYEFVTGQPASGSAEGESLVARELMDTGYSLGEIGHYDEALEAYSRALVIDPGSAWGWGRKGRTLRILHRYNEALQCFERALELNPRYAWAANQRGIVLALQGDLVKAVEAYQDAAQLRPNDPWPIYNQAELLEKEGKLGAALALVDQALLVDPAHGQSYAKRGHLLRALKQYDEALKAYDEALRHVPGDGWVWYGKGVVLYRLHQLDEAVGVLGHATRSHSKSVNAHAWLTLAEVLSVLKRYEEALGASQQAIRLRPNHAVSWSRHGKILMRTRRYEEALIAFSNAGQFAHEATVQWGNQAEALLKLGREDEALDLLDQTQDHLSQQLLTKVQSARMWSLRGKTLRTLGRYKEAVAAYDQSLQLTPTAAWNWYERGQALTRMKRINDAIDSYDRAATLAPKVMWYRENQIKLLLQTGQINDALEVAEQITQEMPTNAKGWASLGQILRRLDRHEDALSAYEQALIHDISYGWAWTGKGLSLLALERWEEAVICHEHASQLPNSNVWTWYHYGKTLIALHRYQDSIEALDKGLMLNPAHKASQILRTEAFHLARN